MILFKSGKTFCKYCTLGTTSIHQRPQRAGSCDKKRYCRSLLIKTALRFGCFRLQWASRGMRLCNQIARELGEAFGLGSWRMEMTMVGEGGPDGYQVPHLGSRVIVRLLGLTRTLFIATPTVSFSMIIVTVCTCLLLVGPEGDFKKIVIATLCSAKMDLASYPHACRMVSWQADNRVRWDWVCTYLFILPHRVAQLLSRSPHSSVSGMSRPSVGAPSNGP